MQVKNKKQLLTTLLSVLISVFLVVGAVMATTTVGLNVNIGSRTSGSGVDLGTYEEGLLVAAQYEDAAALANTTDYVGTAGIFNLHLNRAITLASGGGYGWAAIWANVEIDEAINQTGGTSAGWFTLWADASKAVAGTSRLQGVDIAIVTDSGFSAAANTKLYGLRIDSSVDASATVSGEFAGINIEAAGTKKDWKVGVDINDTVKAIDAVADAGTIASGEVYGMALTFDGTLTSGTSMVGSNIAVTPVGTGGSWVAGIFAKVTQDSTKRVDGYISVAEFELNNAADLASAMSVLTLNWNNSSSVPGAPGGSTQAYIQLRDYSSGTNVSNLLEFTDASVATTDKTTLLSTTSDLTATHTLRITVANVPYWILLNNVGP